MQKDVAADGPGACAGKGTGYIKAWMTCDMDVEIQAVLVCDTCGLHGC